MDIDIRMLMPCDEVKHPFAPLNYLQWLFNTNGYNGKVIRILHKLRYKEFDKFVYIEIQNEFNSTEFIRYDIDNDSIQLFNQSKYVNTVEKFVKYCKKNNINILIEDAKNCTYGLKEY